MITLERDSLVFRFPEVHELAKTEVNFQRTLRIPDNGKHYPLPPGLGSFSLKHLEDFADRIPADWRERAGVMMPLNQAEAMWLSFCGRNRYEAYPFALKIAAGKINAVSGKSWQPDLDASERDYVVVPEQPWLDGFCVAKDVVRQFVAMPLGSGYSVEEQITGKAEHGGLQIIAYPMKKERYEELARRRAEERQRAGAARMYMSDMASASMRRRECAAAPARAMGLAAGGRMRQQIYADPYGIDAWDRTASSRCFVTLMDAVQWQEITGEPPAGRPPSATDYSKASLPWFDYYAADLESLAGAPALALAKSVAELAAEKGEQVLGPDGEVEPAKVVQLGPKAASTKSKPVRESRL
jgi:hypothetical protein